MNEKQLEILDYLKTNCKGKRNAVNGKKLAELFNIKASSVRFNIKAIKNKQDILIGSDIKVGYYIPYKKEVKDALKYRQSKVLSELKGNLKDDPSFILRVFKLLNIKVDDATQGQLRFNVDTQTIESVDYLNEGN